MISSNWKLTLDPGGAGTVIVDYYHYLLEEPEFGLQIGLNVTTIPYGVPHFQLTQADVYSLSITKVFYQTTDAIARREMMEAFTQRYAALGKVPLRLEINGGSHRFDWAEAVFSNPRVRRLMDAGPAGLEAAWSLALSITAKSLTRTVV